MKAKLMPNISLGSNDRLITDILEKLISRDVVCTVAEDKRNVVGMIFFVKDSSLNNLVSPKMMLKFLLGMYGMPRFRNFWAYFNMNKMRELIRDSYHGLMVAVEPEYRKKDVSTKLWKKAAERMNGRITLLIDSENRASIKFAERRINAKRIKIVPDLFEKGKTWVLYVRVL